MMSGKPPCPMQVSAMNKFSSRSLKSLETCDWRLQLVFLKVVRLFDCSVLEGHRDRKRQNELYDQKKTQLMYPMSEHNNEPSRAVDVQAYPIDWEDRERQSLFAGYVIATAAMYGITIRWGGDWDKDTEVKDNKFDDLVHFELVDE